MLTFTSSRLPAWVLRPLALVAVGAAAAVVALPAQKTAGGDYRGPLTLARDGSNDPFDPAVVVDLDLASDRVTVRFDGFDPHRTGAGETAFITRLTAGYIADYGVVAADAGGVPGAPLYVCKSFSFGSNRICHTPTLSRDGQRVAFGTAAGGGSVCKNDYGTAWADYVVVKDRPGSELARFEGYYYPSGYLTAGCSCWGPPAEGQECGSATNPCGCPRVWTGIRSQPRPRFLP